MGYYIRVLSPSDHAPSVAKIWAALARAKLAATLTVEAGTEDDWTQLLLSHVGGPDVAAIERNAASSGLMSAEVEEFLEEIVNCKPTAAAAWLAKYLSKIRTIYAFQLLSGRNVKNGWDIVGSVKDSIFRQAGGILQADAEGFSNEAGYHILWQFSDSVKGTWWMGVLKGGEWVHFQMDLGNKTHREAFLRGDVPQGVKMTGSGTGTS